MLHSTQLCRSTVGRLAAAAGLRHADNSSAAHLALQQRLTERVAQPSAADAAPVSGRSRHGGAAPAASSAQARSAAGAHLDKVIGEHAVEPTCGRGTCSSLADAVCMQAVRWRPQEEGLVSHLSSFLVAVSSDLLKLAHAGDAAVCSAVRGWLVLAHPQGQRHFGSGQPADRRCAGQGGRAGRGRSKGGARAEFASARKTWHIARDGIAEK